MCAEHKSTPGMVYVYFYHAMTVIPGPGNGQKFCSGILRRTTRIEDHEDLMGAKKYLCDKFDLPEATTTIVSLSFLHKADEVPGEFGEINCIGEEL